MSDAEKLELARNVIDSLARNLQALHTIAKMGNKVTVIASLAHMAKRCSEIRKEIS